MSSERHIKSIGLVEQLKRELQLARLPAGTQVESVRKMSVRLGVSAVTANKAMNRLVKEDFLYRVPQSGTYIKHEPPVVPQIGYIGPLQSPDDDSIRCVAAQQLLNHLTEVKVDWRYISYHELCQPSLAGKKWHGTNGLLISADYIDDLTRTTLWNYPGRIVVIYNNYLVQNLPCSQVVPDYIPALRELSGRYDLSSYEKILILSAGYANAVADEANVRRILGLLGVPAAKISTLTPDSVTYSNAQMTAFRIFSRDPAAWKNTLIFSLSGYYSQGIREAYADLGWLPDVLSFDNLESYQGVSEEQSYFTSIDRRVPEIFVEGARLLCQEITEPGLNHRILQMPARLVIRKSIRESQESAREPKPQGAER